MDRSAVNKRAYLRRKGHDIPRATRGKGVHTQRFLALDGEGGNDDDGRHLYTLLLAAGKGYVNHVHNNGRQLSTTQCLDFILSLPRNRVLISFFFSYDVTMMLKDMPEDILAELSDREGRTDPETGHVTKVNYHGYELDWIPGKIFQVSKYVNGRHEHKTIYDTAGFFQTSLVKALEGWKVGDAKEKQFIQSMKNKRDVFGTEVNEELITYCATECVLLCKLMDLVYKESDDLGYTLKSYSGAGSLANSMLAAWNIDKHNTMPTNSRIVDACNHAYFGGRFEVCAIGEIPGPIYEYDINSAYPYAIQSLPDLTNGTWTHTINPLRNTVDDNTLCHVTWNIPQPELKCVWGPLPWRGKTGGILYPLSGEGWYWGSEIQSVMRTSHGKHITLLETYTFTETNPDNKPFSHVPELYARRQELKKQGHLGQLVIKLGINSLYGKTAQNIGKQTYANRAWAGMITAKARAMLTEAIRYAGDTNGYPNIVMCATDAVYSRVRLPWLSIGGDLGQWGLAEHDNMLIVQPGLYALNVDTDRAEIRKTRGIRKTTFNANDVMRLWREQGMAGSFQVPVHSFIGLKRGLISTEYNAGEWVDETRTVSFWPRSKRLAIPLESDNITYLPPIPPTTPVTMSAPYDKDITNKLYEQARTITGNDLYQPDYDDHPSTIEGFVMPNGETKK